LGNFTAVRIENAITKITVRGLGVFYQQDLIAADTKMAVSHGTDLIWGQMDPLADTIEHDKIIAEAMHFREIQCNADSLIGFSYHGQEFSTD